MCRVSNLSVQLLDIRAPHFARGAGPFPRAALNPDLCTTQADFTPQDAAEDTITGRFRGPSQESAQEVYDLIADARANPEKYGRPAPVDDGKKKKRRKKKGAEEKKEEL